MVQISLTTILALAATVQGACTKGPAINDATVDLIKEFEGFVASPKPDPIGLPTVGYGHLCKTKGCKEVPYKFPLTKDTATKLLKKDVAGFQNCITKVTNNKVKLNDNQYGALVSWSFNVGCGNAQSSQLVKRLNKGESPAKVLPAELPKWRMGGGKVLPGLVRRRAAEVKLSKAKTTKGALPTKC
ncbi:lysozyme [Purpureocillium lavendulum]|uniref:Lysozyme n=1 Tax=Purpureocillium lavendulum TaxID=1247861 RepID=A0AB34FLY3_9HYPO|nr:lysozyme [Purpureocillium lavendulum]